MTIHALKVKDFQSNGWMYLVVCMECIREFGV